MSDPVSTTLPETEREDKEFLDDVIAGLQRQPKQLAPKYFYDEQGSRYFDQICQLDEYYPYRTELKLLPKVAKDLNDYFRQQTGDGIHVIEFGAGSLHKIKPLLEHLEQIEEFTAIDISGAHLQSACEELKSYFPALTIHGVEGDFTKPFPLKPDGRVHLGFFPGSTIGNLAPAEAIEFLANAQQTLGPDSYMLLGVDTKKDERLLHQAYNDSAGVTAKFNKNVLVRINRELGGNFDLDGFRHEAWYNDEKGRVEMHLRSVRDQRVTLDEQVFDFAEGETIHTENSYKYHPQEFEDLAAKAGWHAEKWWLADDQMFSVTLLRSDK